MVRALAVVALATLAKSEVVKWAAVVKRSGARVD